MESQSANNLANAPSANEPAASADTAPFARLVIRTPDGQSVSKDILRPTTLVGSVGPCNIELVGPDVAQKLDHEIRLGGIGHR